MTTTGRTWRQSVCFVAAACTICLALGAAFTAGYGVGYQAGYHFGVGVSDPDRPTDPHVPPFDEAFPRR